MSGRIPWKYSEQLGGEYVYSPSRDEIILRNGGRFQRPRDLPRASLGAASFEVPDLNALPTSGEPAYPISRGPAPGSYEESRPRNTQNFSSSPPSSYTNTNDLASRFTNMTVSNSITQSRGGVSSQSRNPPPRDPRYQATIITNARQGSDSRQTVILDSEVVGSRNTEQLFPEYRQRKKSFYFIGKVFSILWSEPAGSQTQATSFDEGITIGPFGERVYSKIRRFVVIRAGDNYCNALPISTYGTRGVGKHGVNKSEHCIIYTGQQPSMLLAEEARRGETPMRPTAIRVDPDNKEDKLDPKSRLNYGSPFTIQHNVKVKSCGKVAAEFVQLMILQFADVFGIRPPSSSSVPTRRDVETRQPQSRIRMRPAAAAPDDDDDDDDDDEDNPNDDGDDGDDSEEDNTGDHESSGNEDGGGDEDDDDDDDDNNNNNSAMIVSLRQTMAGLRQQGYTQDQVMRMTQQRLTAAGMSAARATTLIRTALNQ